MTLLLIFACTPIDFQIGDDKSEPLDTPAATPPTTTTGAPILQVEPAVLDFGVVGIGCEATETVTLSNTGDAELVVTDLTYVDGSAELTLDRSGLSQPLVLAPGAAASVTVTYAPLDEGADVGSFTVLSNDPARPELVTGHVGEGARIGERIDRYVQTAPPVDVLFVVDNSCSMAEEQVRLTSNFAVFISLMSTLESHFQVAVITTDDPAFRGPIITDATLDPVSEFLTQAVVGTTGSGDERGLAMAWQATRAGGDAGPGSAFLRDDAHLALVFVTDEVDNSAISGMSWSDYLADYQALKSDPDWVVANAIAGDLPGGCSTADPGVGYYETVAATRGVYLSVCESDWAGHLQAIGEVVSTLDDRFEVTGDPMPGSLEVWVDGVEATTGWTWFETEHVVVFETLDVPLDGAVVELRYLEGGSCGS